MVAVIGLTGFKKLEGIAAAPPATIKTVIVSPIARPIPKITAVTIPELAVGNITLLIVSHLVPPNANEASLYLLGIEVIASSDKLIIVGKAIIPNIIEAVKAVNPVGNPNTSFKKGPNIFIPNKPYITEGI